MGEKSTEIEEMLEGFVDKVLKNMFFSHIRFPLPTFIIREDVQIQTNVLKLPIFGYIVRNTEKASTKME